MTDACAYPFLQYPLNLYHDILKQMINVINTALSGLAAAAKRVEATASNIANVSSAGALDPANGRAPYTALTTTQTSVSGANGTGLGVRSEFAPLTPGFVPAFDPGSPFADENGLIGVPNVNLAQEAVNLKLAEVTYKAHASVLRTADELSEELLRALDRDA